MTVFSLVMSFIFSSGGETLIEDVTTGIVIKKLLEVLALSTRGVLISLKVN